MPPFTAKEVARYFFWIALLAVAIAAIVWFTFNGPGHRTVHPTRNGATVGGTV